MRRMGVKTEMIYTGQTGWLQGIKHGFIFDATLNDFVSGELEHAIISCYEERKPDIILIEGQASLRNPSGPCGAEFLVSGDLSGVVLQYIPGRKYFRVNESLKLPIPSLESEIELIAAYGQTVLAVCLNTEGLSLEEAKSFQTTYQKRLNLPIILPIEDGASAFDSYREENNWRNMSLAVEIKDLSFSYKRPRSRRV